MSAAAGWMGLAVAGWVAAGLFLWGLVGVSLDLRQERYRRRQEEGREE